FAKYAAAFFKISASIFSRAFSARSREISIWSGVIGLPLPASPSLPSACALTQLRIDCSGTPISRAILLTGSPPRTRRNASSLNSSVYAAFGILFIEHLRQRYYPALLLVPDNRWEAHNYSGRLRCGELVSWSVGNETLRRRRATLAVT